MNLELFYKKKKYVIPYIFYGKGSCIPKYFLMTTDKILYHDDQKQ
jgi:hypothetical protein